MFIKSINNWLSCELAIICQYNARPHLCQSHLPHWKASVMMCFSAPNLISFTNEHLLPLCLATLLRGRTQFRAKRKQIWLFQKSLCRGEEHTRDLGKCLGRGPSGDIGSSPLFQLSFLFCQTKNSCVKSIFCHLFKSDRPLPTITDPVRKRFGSL